MKIRIRSSHHNDKSKWIYLSDQIRTVELKKPEPVARMMMMLAEEDRKKYVKNQYGRFRYAEYQYGKMEMQGSLIEIIKRPIRIKRNDGSYVYTQYQDIHGACPAIRIRAKGKGAQSEWTYIQHEEVDNGLLK